MPSVAPPAPPPWRDALLLLAVAAILLFARLGAAPLWDRDEPRNARCAVEMAQAGNWIVPTFNGELRAHKPVLLYWLIGTAHAAAGVGEGSSRFWSALLGLGTIMVTYRLGLAILNPRAALWAGIALATSPIFLISARAATPDAALLFFSTLALAGVLRTVMAGRKPIVANATWAWLGLATLSKGLAGLIPPLLVAATWMFGDIASDPTGSPSDRLARSRRRLKHWTTPRGIGLFLMVTLPWFLAVGVLTRGQFLVEFFGEHHWRRAVEAMEGHRGPGPLYYLASLLVGTFPWSVLAGPLALDLWRQRPVDPVRRFLLAWCAIYVALFSLAATKLPSYILPCYPAVALLLGSFVERLEQDATVVPRHLLRLSSATLGIIGGAIAFGVLGTALVWAPSLWWLAMAGVPSMYFASRSTLPLPRRLAFTATSTWLVVFTLALPTIGRRPPAPKIAALVASRGGTPRLIAYGPIEPSVIYYLGQHVEELPQSRQGAATLRTALTSGVDVLAIADEQRIAELRAATDDAFDIIATIPKLSPRGSIVLLAPRRSSPY